ncbi:hypothetical protein C8R46DRAFT_894584 [Mycena filopes]|nr:hypothetical protein C8R46DRAFT_894584 [Mycena filopes]
MSLSIDIVPLAHSLDMYGQPHSSSAFSLSGHVSIALSSPYSVFERRRPARILLQSVLLTFDGQTEVITEHLGYSPLRLYSKTVELAPSQPLELTNEDAEDTEEPCRWNIVFDLPIPGWLPASHEFSAAGVGASTQYFLHAVVKFLVIDEQRATPWSFSTLCSPFRSRAQSIQTRKTITLRRFVEPPTDEPTPVEPVNYLLSGPKLSKGAPIPAEILSKIQVLASVPKHVDVCDSHLPFTLRLRTKGLEDEHCKRLQVTEFRVELAQEETFRRMTDASVYRTQYPLLPSADCQPPIKPLLKAHHMCDMYKLGLFLTPSASTSSATCSSTLLPGGETGIYHLTGDRAIFAQDVGNETATWYTMETTIPFVHDLEAQEGSPASSNLRPSVTSPIYGVSHSLKLSVRCEYQMPDGGELAVAELSFAVPLTFGRIAPPLPPRDILPALYTAMRLTDGTYPSMPELLPCANLPAYSQLFDSRGNRKVDATPLPLYTPRSSSDSEAPVDLLPSNDDLLLPFSNEKQDLHATTV